MFPSSSHSSRSGSPQECRHPPSSGIPPAARPPGRFDRHNPRHRLILTGQARGRRVRLLAEGQQVLLTSVLLDSLAELIVARGDDPLGLGYVRDLSSMTVHRLRREFNRAVRAGHGETLIETASSSYRLTLDVLGGDVVRTPDLPALVRLGFLTPPQLEALVRLCPLVDGLRAA